MSDLDLLGRTVGRFEILEELGRGGMAVVYKARQRSPNRLVALKVLPPALTHDKGYVARFLREADSAAALEHPHIVPIYAVDQADGLYYIAMKLISGRTLKDVVQQEGAMSLARAAHLLGQVGEALDYAHSQGVIHRDIKPSNMMLADGGWMYLTDFGLARGTSGTSGLTVAGTVMGTPEYMSPEQATGSATVGPPTDIYALGVVLYELLTNQFPFQSDTPMGMLLARLTQPPRPPRDYRHDLPDRVEDIVMRALARRPEARYPTAAAMITDLRRAAGVGEGFTTVQPPITPSGGLRPATPPPLPPPTPSGGMNEPTVLTPIPPPSAPVSYPAPLQQGGQTPSQPPLPPLPPPGQPSYPPPPSAAPRSNRGLLIGLGVGLLALVAIVALIVALVRDGSAPATPTAVAQATRTPQQATRGPTAPPTAVPTADVTTAAGLVQAAETALQQKGGFAAAIGVYEGALQEKSDNPTALAHLALLRELKGDHANALSLADDAISAADDRGSDAALAYAVRARALLAAGDTAGATEAATSAIERDSDLALGHGARARARATIAAARNDQRLIQQAIDDVNRTLASLGDESALLQAVAHEDVGYTYGQESKLYDRDTELRRYEDAVRRSLDQTSLAMNSQPEVPAFRIALGMLYIDQGSYDQARSQFNRAIALDPDAAEAYAGIGWSYFQQDATQKYDDALAALDKAISINDSLLFPHYAKGRLLLEQKQYDEAITMLAAAVERGPQDALAAAWLGEAYTNKGFNSDDTNVKSESYGQAEGAFRKALELNDRQTFAHTNLGWVLQYQDRYEESLTSFQASLAIKEAQDSAHNGLGWSLYYLNRFQEAEVHFRRATALYKEYANAFYGLGQTLEKLNRRDEAKQAYSEAVRINPNYQSAKDALARLQ